VARNDVGTPKNGDQKEAGKGGAEFPPHPPSAPPALRSRAWGGKRLRHSAVIRISKQKNFLFLLKEKGRAKKLMPSVGCIRWIHINTPLRSAMGSS